MSSQRAHRPDSIFLALVGILLFVGFLIFTSASFGLLTRGSASPSSIAFNQLVLGLGGGLVVGLILYRIPYQLIRRYSFYIFVGALLLTCLVFVPGIGFEANGAKRWIHVFGISMQPSELLKFAFIAFFASWLTTIKKDIGTFKFGLLPMIGIVGVTGAVIIAQPDNGTFIAIFATAVVMFIAAGAKWKHLGMILVAVVLGFTLLAVTRPYVMSRIMTFIDPSSDPYNSSYHIQQAFVAIGSGGLAGRGFGQSIQKFNYLPEPVGDSIFAVYSEEFGFLGGIVLIGLFVFLGWRGLTLAERMPDTFARLATIGIVIMIIAQSFLNMGAMLGVVPLTGVPLVFISHGGTALLAALAQVGFLLQLSRYTQESS